MNALHNSFTTILLLISFSFSSCTQKKDTEEQIVALKENYEHVFDIFTEKNDILYVVNFWATWCQPCVEELPDFIKTNEKHKNNPQFKMILISLDRAKDFKTKVNNFIIKNNVTPDVYLLSDNKRMNEWIRKINLEWEGEIPVTAFYRNGKQLKFINHPINHQTLEKEIKNLLY